MKAIFRIVQFLLLMCGVFGADEVKTVSVLEGDSVTLHPDLTQIRRFDQILWRFGEQGSEIAKIFTTDITYEDDEIFSERLQLDQTGTLTVRNMRRKHSGRYKAEISHSTGELNTIFMVTVYEPPTVIDAVRGEMKTVSVTEGDTVTLQTGVTVLQRDDLIVWRSGDEGKLIAKQDKETNSSASYDTEERFRDRLELDQTGSLTITNTRNTDSGLYRVKISSNTQTLHKRFTVTVSDPPLSVGAVAGIVIIVLLLCAAVAAVMYYLRPRTTTLPSQTWSVPMGDIITLDPETEIQTSDEVQWLFGAKERIIAQIKGKKKERTLYDSPDQIFTNKLELEWINLTGSLTITDTAVKHTGLYTLKIRRGRETLYKRFMISVEKRRTLVIDGDRVTLEPDAEIKKDYEIEWEFEDEEQKTVLAKIKNTEETKYDGPDERFRDRLELNKKTGSLTITKFTAKHTGDYTVKIRRARETIYKRFFVSSREREITVMDGDDVTLDPDTEVKNDDVIQWWFIGQGEQTVIAEIRGEPREIFTHDERADGRFRDRLELEINGSLTITNTTALHSGYYKLEITSSSRGVSEQTFVVTVKGKEEKKVVNKGESVTLSPDTKIQRDDLILWMFGPQDKLIAHMKRGSVERYDGPDKRFRDRLELDETGSLTIKDIRPEHTGDYKLQIISSSSRYSFKKFKVLVRYVIKDIESTRVEMPDEEDVE